MNKFKVGDKVRCVDEWAGHVLRGEVYTVKGAACDYLRLEEVSRGVQYCATRFVLAGLEGQTKAVEPGGGMKFDGDKPDYRDLLNPLLLGCIDGIRGVVAVLKFGAKKYKANSWQVLQDAEARYTKALLRHMADIEAHGILHRDVNDKGEADANHSGLLSIYHVCCDALFLAYFATKRAKAQAEKETH